MPKGVITNPNPSPETRFGGPRGNPINRTAEQRELELRNAWIATQIRAQMLEAVAATLANDGAAALSRIEPSTLKLLKDAEDRGLGTPKASVDMTTNGKDMPGGIDLNQLSPEALAELVALNDATAKD